MANGGPQAGDSRPLAVASAWDAAARAGIAACGRATMAADATRRCLCREGIVACRQSSIVGMVGERNGSRRITTCPLASTRTRNAPGPGGPGSSSLRSCRSP